MSLKELYSQIKNPIDDGDIIRILALGYIDNQIIYGLLTNCIEKDNMVENEEEKDKFGRLMFNTWKNNIVNMDEDKIKHLIINTWRREINGKSREESIVFLNEKAREFMSFRRYLKNIPDAKTCMDIDDFFENVHKEKKFNDMISKYGHEHQTEGWEHIFSSRIFLDNKQSFEVEHRLYLNPNLFGIHKLMRCYIEKCIDNGVSFYFKYDSDAGRDDCVVIYTNSENLAKNVQILREIVESFPDLKDSLYYPPILTGNIDGWIGYGTEPQSIDNLHSQSFNSKREDFVYKIIESSFRVWYQQRGRKEDIIHEVCNRIILGLKSKVNSGAVYTLKDINSMDFKSKLHHKIKNDLEAFLINGENPRSNKIKDIKLKNGKIVHIDAFWEHNIIKKVVGQEALKDEHYIRVVQQCFREFSLENDIDENNFAIDSSAKKKILGL